MENTLENAKIWMEKNFTKGNPLVRAWGIPKVLFNYGIFCSNKIKSDCLNIAKGCHDYGGGYRTDEESKIFHHGIQTVVNCLEVYNQKGLTDLQLTVLHNKGFSSEGKNPIETQQKLK